MQFDVRIPCAALRDSVSMLWHWRDPDHAHAMERLMPNGEMTLVVNLAEDIVRIYDSASLRLTDKLPGAVLVGAHSQPLVIDSEEQKHVFGIQFRAGAAFAFFSPSADEVTNLHVDLRDLWRADLRSRLLDCHGDADAMFQAAERILLAQLRNRREMHPAVRYAVQQLQQDPRGQTVRRLVDATGLSSRRFLQLFKEQTGLPPKVFGRLQRFQSAIALVHRRSGAADWTQVALECGYYDQSHLMRDFREFAGMSPGAYAAAGGRHQNHVPIL